MFRLPSPRTAIALAGLSLSLGSAPALAVESIGSRTAPAGPAAQTPQVAMLPGLPSAGRRYDITPELRALLNTIRYAEGTWKNGDPIGYQVMFGGGIFPSLDRHPDRVVYSSRYASAAAGAYQFMPFTWDMIRRQLSVSDFGRDAQDQGAVFLIERRGALRLATSGQFTPELAARLAPEWASFPTLRGSSFYGQPVKRFAELRRFYQDNLAQLRQEQNQPDLLPVAVEPEPPVCTDNSLQCRLDSIGPRPRVAVTPPAAPPIAAPQEQVNPTTPGDFSAGG